MTQRTMDLVHGLALAMEQVRTSGEVECPAKGLMARDRCLGNQVRGVCSCELGRWVREQAMRYRLVEGGRLEARDGERRWTIVCQGCGQVKVMKVTHGCKPQYCDPRCAKRIYNARYKDPSYRPRRRRKRKALASPEAR